jgi:hypothetical protein
MPAFLLFGQRELFPFVQVNQSTTMRNQSMQEHSSVCTDPPYTLSCIIHCSLTQTICASIDLTFELQPPITCSVDALREAWLAVERQPVSRFARLHETCCCRSPWQRQRGCHIAYLGRAWRDVPRSPGQGETQRPCCLGHVMLSRTRDALSNTCCNLKQIKPKFT